MFVVIAKQKTLPGKSEIFKENVAEMAPFTRQYPGCISYKLLQSKDNENEFVFCETWDNEKDFKAHFEAEFTKRFEKTLDGVAAGEVEPCIYDVVI